METLHYNGIEFDDYVIENGFTWSQICSRCAYAHNLDITSLGGGVASGSICGVAGCSDLATYIFTWMEVKP